VVVNFLLHMVAGAVARKEDEDGVAPLPKISCQATRVGRRCSG
jgi:hypothetical protein